MMILSILAIFSRASQVHWTDFWKINSEAAEEKNNILIIINYLFLQHRLKCVKHSTYRRIGNPHFSLSILNAPADLIWLFLFVYVFE